MNFSCTGHFTRRYRIRQTPLTASLNMSSPYTISGKDNPTEFSQDSQTSKSDCAVSIIETEAPDNGLKDDCATYISNNELQTAAPWPSLPKHVGRSWKDNAVTAGYGLMAISAAVFLGMKIINAILMTYKSQLLQFWSLDYTIHTLERYRDTILEARFFSQTFLEKVFAMKVIGCHQKYASTGSATPTTARLN